MTTTIGPGITVGAGISLTSPPASIVTTGLVLSLADVQSLYATYKARFGY